MTEQFTSANEQEVTSTRNLDAEMKGHQEAIDLAAALKRMMKTADFKKLIKQGYLKDWAHNLVMQRSYPDFRNNDKMMEANTRKIDSVSEFNHYLTGVRAMGAQAEHSLKEARKLQNSLTLVGE